jgi:hypothetical protein
MSSGAGVENVDEALQLLTGSKPARILMAQVRQPLSDRNGREGQASGGHKHVDDMNVAELRQEVFEIHNMIYQLRKNAEPSKQQRQSNWQGGRRGPDPQHAEHPGPKGGVRVPEGAAKGAKPQQKSPAKAQAHMLRTSRR